MEGKIGAVLTSKPCQSSGEDLGEGRGRTIIKYYMLIILIEPIYNNASREVLWGKVIVIKN